MKMSKGFFYGTGSAVNVEVGFVPNVVYLTNITDGDTINTAYPSLKRMAFTSGGTNEIKPGHVIVGATSGARAAVRYVALTSGSWAGGDAAGTFLVDSLTVSGTFTSENVYYDGSSTINDATGAALAVIGQLTDTAVATNTNVAVYAGSTTAAQGFTVASGASESGKLFGWVALAN